MVRGPCQKAARETQAERVQQRTRPGLSRWTAPGDSRRLREGGHGSSVQAPRRGASSWRGVGRREEREERRWAGWAKWERESVYARLQQAHSHLAGEPGGMTYGHLRRRLPTRNRPTTPVWTLINVPGVQSYAVLLCTPAVR